MNFGGILKIVAPLAITALTGGAAAPLAATIQQVAVKAAVQLAFQKIGQELGIPNQLVNLASTAALGQMGGGSADFSSAANNAFGFSGSAKSFLSNFGANTSSAIGVALTAVQSGALDRAVNQFESRLTDMLLERIKDSAPEEVREMRAGSKVGGSLLMKIAVLLGKMLDEKMTDMANLAGEIGQLGQQNGKDLRHFGKVTASNTARFEAIKTENQSKLGELTGRLQGLGQEVGLLSNAISSTIKSIGEGATTLARKG